MRSQEQVKDKRPLKVTPESAIKNFNTCAINTKNAALALVCSATAYLMNVNLFREKGSEGYLTKPEAMEQLHAQLSDVTKVGSKQFDIYISRASALYDKLVSIRELPKVTELLSEAEGSRTAGAVTEAILAFISSFNWPLIKAPITSLNSLSRALGYAVSGDQPPAPADKPLANNITPLPTDIAKVAAERVSTSMDQVTKSLENLEPKQREEAQQRIVEVTASKAPDPVLLVKETIRHIIPRADAVTILHELLEMIEKQLTLLERPSGRRRRAA